MSSLVISWICVIATGAVAYHGLTYRDARGDKPIAHMLFGAVGLLFCLRFFFFDILGVW